MSSEGPRNATLPNASDDPGTSEDFASDDEFSALFAAFDETHASAELKSATLAKIVDAENAGEAPAQLGGKTPVKVIKGSSARRSKRRALQLIALAACLAFALVGGTAYATPTAHVQIGSGSSSIDLGVNRFGIAVSAKSDDETLNQRISESQLDNKPAAEAIEKAVALFDQTDPTQAVEISVQADDDGQRSYLEDEAERRVQRQSESVSATQPDSSPETGLPNEPKDDGQPAETSSEQNRGQDADRQPDAGIEPGPASAPGASPQPSDRSGADSPDGGKPGEQESAPGGNAAGEHGAEADDLCRVLDHLRFRDEAVHRKECGTCVIYCVKQRRHCTAPGPISGNGTVTPPSSYWRWYGWRIHITPATV